MTWWRLILLTLLRINSISNFLIDTFFSIFSRRLNWNWTSTNLYVNVMLLKLRAKRTTSSLLVKLCDPCLSALCVPWCKKALHINTLPFLSLPAPSEHIGLIWILYKNVREGHKVKQCALQSQRNRRGRCCSLVYYRQTSPK